MSENETNPQAVADSDTSALPEGLHYDETARAAPTGQRSLGAAVAMAPIGGQLISSVGGLVGFCPIGGTPNVIGPPTQVVEGGGAAPPTPAQTNYLDCARWQSDLTPAVDDVTQTLAWAQAVHLTLPQGRFRVEIINDHRFTPAMLAKYGLINPTMTGNVSFNLGCRMTLLHGNAANYPTFGVEPGGPAIVPDWYYCPSVKLLNPNTVIDAIGKKMVRSLPLEVVCNAPVFHLPYEKPQLTAYLAHLANIFQGF